LRPRTSNRVVFSLQPPLVPRKPAPAKAWGGGEDVVGNFWLGRMPLLRGLDGRKYERAVGSFPPSAHVKHAREVWMGASTKGLLVAGGRRA
jgi:hypothetical protein